MKLTHRHSHKWFTIVELMIAMTLFSIMSGMIFTIYFNATELSRRLNMTRELSETAREITERLAIDVREKGIADVQSFDKSAAYPLWQNNAYTTTGGDFITIVDGIKYVYGHKSVIAWGTTSFQPCTDTLKADPKVHCGLYLYTTDPSSAFDLVDSFVPDEDKKRVKITDLKFYISGTPGQWGFQDTAKKVTINMTLALMARPWVPASLIGATTTHIQTTLSERFFKMH